jgi:membrane-associated phospholipid phosphatase
LITVPIALLRPAPAVLLLALALGTPARVSAQSEPDSRPDEAGEAGAEPVTAAREGGPIRAVEGAVLSLGRDFWRTFSAPVRMDRRAWLETAGVLAVGGLLYAADEDIMRAVRRNREEPGVDEIVDLGTTLEPVGLMGNTNVWYATAAVASEIAGWDRPNRIFTELLYSHWIAGVIRGGTNHLVGRARPNRGLGSRHFESGNGTSFPSGHASTVFQVAAVLAHHAESTPVSVLLYGLAGTVAVQRVSSEQHWASDVWLGAAYGWAVARLVIRLHEEDGLRLEPVAAPGGATGLAVRIAF